MGLTKTVVRVLVSLGIVCQFGLNREEFWSWLCYEVFGEPRRLHATLMPLVSPLLSVIVIVLFKLLYWLELPWLEHNRSYPPSIPWPWKHPDAAVRREYADLEWRTMKRMILTQTVIASIAVAMQWRSNPDLELVLPSTIPSRFVVAVQLYMLMVLHSFYFYWHHRAFHSRLLYHLHKTHHEFKNTSIVGGFNLHPVEAIIVGIAILIMHRLLGVHLYVQFVHFVLLQIQGGISDHSGYNIDFWITPLDISPSPAEHDVHHRISINHNFATGIKLWDVWFGTYLAPATSLRVAK